MRHSIDAPRGYVSTNLAGQVNVLELARTRRLSAPCLSVVVVCLRDRRQAAVQRRRPHRRARFALCSDQARPRAAQRKPCFAVPLAADRLALLHRPLLVGMPRYRAVAFHRSRAALEAAAAVQPRDNVARFRLYRRHRRRRARPAARRRRVDPSGRLARSACVGQSRNRHPRGAADSVRTGRD